MDDLSRGGDDLREALRHLRRLNRLFGAAGPTVYGVKRLWAVAGKPSRLSVLDIGCGSGDVNRRLLRWADERGIEIAITLADITVEACEEARRLFRGEPRVTVMKLDLLALPEDYADIVTGTQVVHHFAAGDLPVVIGRMVAASRLGAVVNDIHRHWLPWAAVWAATHLVSRNRYIRHDGPLSVAKGFQPADWERLRSEAGLSDMSYKWRPLFRYAVVIRKQDESKRAAELIR